MSRAALRIALLSVLTLALPMVVPGAPAQARDTVVTSFDGTRLQVHFFPADGLHAGDRAPVVFVATGTASPVRPARTRPGWRARRASPGSSPPGTTSSPGTPRGHGNSGGTAMFDSPDYEVRGVHAIIDWVARQPEVQLDAPGDPRMRMSGASYGGIIQYLSAAFDHRVDVITPGYTAYSLSTTTITTYGKFKEGWAEALSAITTQNILPGLTSPLGPYLHTPDPATISGLAGSTAAGTLTPEFRAYLDHRSPSTYLSRVHVPTLVTGGTSDTLFPLMNAVRDFRYLKAHGVPVQLSWNCEGHSVCPGATGPLVKHFDGGVIGWFDRWLKGRRAVDTRAPFSWIADNEDHYRTAGMFPPPVTGHLAGSGSGRLAIVPTTPSSPGFVLLGGARHTVRLDLNAIATRATAMSKYRLQLMPSSLIFGEQRSAGLALLEKVSVALPVINAKAAPRLSIGRVTASARSVLAWLSAKREAYRGAQVRLSRQLASGRWAPVGDVAVGRVALTGRVVAIPARVVPGRYAMTVRGVDAYGKSVTLRRTFVVRR